MKKPVEAVIEDVIIQPNKIQPIIVNFQNGDLKDEEASKMKCGLFVDEKLKKTVLALSNDQIVYKGYRPDIDKEATYTMLAIHNKKTGKVKLVQAERWDVAPVLDKQIEDSNEDYQDRLIALNKQFGSKKAKRRTEQFEKMKVNIDIVKEELENSISKIEIDRSQLVSDVQDSSAENLALPEPNRDASDVSEIYKWQDIVPEEILELLYETAESDIEYKNKPKFFETVFEVASQDPERKLKIALLLYIEAIINWLAIPIKNSRGCELKVCSCKEVAKYVINTYSIQNATGPRHRPNIMRDKGIAHCIILSLMLTGYTLDLELFASMFKLRISLKRFVDIARYVAAVPVKENKNCVALKLPLPEPVKVTSSKKGPTIRK